VADVGATGGTVAQVKHRSAAIDVDIVREPVSESVVVEQRVFDQHSAVAAENSILIVMEVTVAHRETITLVSDSAPLSSPGAAVAPENSIFSTVVFCASFTQIPLPLLVGTVELKCGGHHRRRATSACSSI